MTLRTVLASGFQTRAAPFFVAVSLFLVAGTYGAFTSSVHRDEDQYVWAGGYLIHQIATADTSSDSNGRYDDPHWDPFTPWTLGMGTGTRLVYGLGLLLTPSTYAPGYPWAINAPNIEETLATPHTIRMLRLLAVLCGAIGIGLIALRVGWSAVLAAILILSLPHGITTFSRAWAEGPLLLAFGLCAVAFGTVWFAPALGVALTFKLTALGLWPLVFLKRARVLPLWKALLAMVGTFILLTPPSLFLGGPLFIVKLVHFRGMAYDDQSSDGAFLPSRYFWPFELAAVLIVCEIIRRVAAARSRRRLVADGDEVARGEAQGRTS